MEIPCPDSKSITNALYVEHYVQKIITEQERVGVGFNKTRASFYVYTLRERKNQLYNEIRPYLSLSIEQPFNQPVSKPFLKDGSYSSSTKKWYEKSNELSMVSGPFTRIRFNEPNLSSRKQLVGQLLRRNWRPIHFTEKGNPKLTYEGEPCASLLKIGDKVGEWIAEWYILAHRENQISGWISRLRSDGRLSAEGVTIGTPTYRFRHKTVVNVPRSTSVFGKRMRSLFTVDKGRRLVGYDASGLELRILAHYINDEEYSYEVTNGDIHTKNQTDAGIDTRDDAKTFIYAFIYGAGNGKIGSIIGSNATAGARLKATFLSKNPKLAKIIKEIESAAKRGYLQGIDGRKLILRRDKFTGKPQTHKGLNTIIQAGGAIVMKWAMVLMDCWIKELNLDAKKVIDMHDEAQWDCSIKDSTTVGKLGVLSIIQAGILLKLNVALAGEYKVGLNWSHTH